MESRPTTSASSATRTANADKPSRRPSPAAQAHAKVKRRTEHARAIAQQIRLDF